MASICCGKTLTPQMISMFKPHKLSKPLKGLFDKHKLEPRRTLREFRLETADGYEIGQEIRVDLFETGEKVDVRGVSKIVV